MRFSQTEVSYMTRATFKQITGQHPKEDDLDRANCLRAGEVGHHSCGVCSNCSMPRFIGCDCAVMQEHASKQRRNKMAEYDKAAKSYSAFSTEQFEEIRAHVTEAQSEAESMEDSITSSAADIVQYAEDAVIALDKFQTEVEELELALLGKDEEIAQLERDVEKLEENYTLRKDDDLVKNLAHKMMEYQSLINNSPAHHGVGKEVITLIHELLAKFIEGPIAIPSSE